MEFNKKKEYDKKYRADKKKYYQVYLKKWREENKEKVKLDRQEYRYHADGTKKEKYKKKQKISNWKQLKMKPLENETWDYIYDVYQTTTHCMGCGSKFEDERHKLLDHDHKNGYVRGVLCYGCNNRYHDVLKNMF